MEQDGWVAYNEQVFLPSTIMFTVEKNSLYEFEKNNPRLEPCIKALLRAYEGIIDRPTPVSERMIAGLLKKDAESVRTEWNELHRFGIIDYRPQKDSPQLLLVRPRIKAADLSIDTRAFEQRKERFRQRVNQMIRYIKEEQVCRSRMISAYFGDDRQLSCGVCDNCLRQKAIHLTKEEFDRLHHRIINIIKYESLHTRDLLEKLNGFKKEKAWRVLEFLQAENKIEMDSAGKVRLK